MTEDKKNTRKGLLCSIFEDKRIGNCSNGGISETHKEVLVVMEEKEAQVFDEKPERPTVKIVKRKLFGGEEYIHAEPIEGTKKGHIGFMAGGTFIYSCDSRFSNLVSPYPVPLHDRQETPEQYDQLSR